MTDPITRLNAALEGRYRVEREIGEGGILVRAPRRQRGMRGDIISGRECSPEHQGRRFSACAALVCILFPSWMQDLEFCVVCRRTASGPRASHD